MRDAPLEPPAPPPRRNRPWVRMSVFIAAILLSAALLYGTGALQFFMDHERMHRFIRSLGAWGFAGFILLQVVQVVAAPIPGEATGFIGGFLYGPVLGIVLSTIGLTIGSYIAFALSRSFGRPLVERHVDPSVIARFDYLLHHKGAFLVFLLFLLPGFPKDYLCFLLGLGHLTTLEFLAIATVGRLLGTTLLTMGGAYVRNQQYTQFFVLCGAAVVVVFLAIAYKDRLERRFREWHERRGGRRKGGD